MRSRLQTAIESLSDATDRATFTTTVLNLRDILETDHIIYHAVNHPSREFAVASYSEAWQSHYAKEGLTRIDPVVRGCLRNYGPVHWDTLDWAGRRASRLMSDAIDAGVGSNGLSLPLRGPDGQFSVFSISHAARPQDWKEKIGDLIEDVILISHYVNQKALDLVEEGKDLSIGDLSPRERDALNLLAVGMNRGQAADFLGISEHTLRVYIENARLKLSAENTLHAVARAMSLGLLSP